MKREEWLHHEWLSLLEISGPFLSIEVLKDKLPQGLESIETSVRKRLRVAYDEWDEAWYENDPELDALLEAWVKMVLQEVLEYEESEFIKPKGDEFRYSPMEHDGSISADFAISREGEEKPDFFVSIQEPGIDLDKILPGDAWPANVLERVVKLCRDKDVRFALVTNGERWTLVNAPRGSMSSTISWYSRIWFQEPVTFRAFRTLLSVSRLYGPTEDRLEVLLDESLEKHEEVTDTLGEQVRRAVEVLVQSLDRADRDRNRELLKDVEAKTLYEAGLTVMMRLVFVLSAEERNLLLLGDPIYDSHYAVSNLRSLLSEEADRHGTEVLERRYDAWSRLLAVFRGVYGGIEHESLRMPALGGSLFDPDRFPFLEGRSKGSHWKEESAKPLPIDNRTVLLLLKALQVLERSGGALQLSYKALDVEQIGHVYEGLLEYTVKRMPTITLGLTGSKKAKNPTIALEELEALALEGVDKVSKALAEITGRGISPLKKDLEKPVDEKLYASVLLACSGDSDLAERIRPFAHLLAQDAWGDLLIYGKDSFAVMPGSERSATGAHYTPKSLTESVVATTLEPILYEGPAEGKPKEEWKLISTEKIVSLKICDPAMGSGAFLVQTCRYLAERLVEAWGVEEKEGRAVTAQGEIVEILDSKEPLSKSLDDRLILARRIVAERCLYGVDLNPLAVELAKLSLWLVTLSKGRPFGFLDHSLRVGDSLLGIDNIDKLIKFTMEPEKKINPTLFAKDLEEKVKDVLRLRDELRSICILDIEDVETMKILDEKAKDKLSIIETIADAMVGEVLRTGGKKQSLEKALDALSSYVVEALNGEKDALLHIETIAKQSLSIDLSEDSLPRKPFHWALEFPEVFVEQEGFDAIVGNPPFLGGQKITGFMGTAYREYLVEILADGKKGSADFVAYFFLRAFSLLSGTGYFTFISTKTIGEGATRTVGLDTILDNNGTIYNVISAYRWPGKAAVLVTVVSITKHKYKNFHIDNQVVQKIDSSLSSGILNIRERNILYENKNRCSIGSYLQGVGFYIPVNDALSLLKSDEKLKDVIRPIVRGDDILNCWEEPYPFYGINFGTRSLEDAQKFHKAFEIVEKNVKPEREKGKDEKLAKFWWKYKRPTEKLYKAVQRYEKVLVHGFTSKYVAFRFVSAKSIFVAPLVVIISDDWSIFGVLQSNIHQSWVENVSNMGTTLRYTPSECFETFPFPSVDTNSLKQLSEELYNKRENIMKTRKIGLTDLYNLYHNVDVQDSDIELLRALHVKLDKQVIDLYNWKDIILNHDFINTSKGLRYTISETNLKEVLDKLLKLNHLKYKNEIDAGLWDKKGGAKKVKKGEQGGLF